MLAQGHMYKPNNLVPKLGLKLLEVETSEKESYRQKMDKEDMSVSAVKVASVSEPSQEKIFLKQN